MNTRMIITVIGFLAAIALAWASVGGTGGGTFGGGRGGWTGGGQSEGGWFGGGEREHDDDD